jgi:hypothetical protein
MRRGRPLNQHADDGAAEIAGRQNGAVLADQEVEQMGFDEILIGSQFDAIEEIERVRDFLDG